jgi:hypothetical protein
MMIDPRMGAHIKSIEAYHDFITTVVLCAPDRFPIREYHSARLDVESAFAILLNKFGFVEERIADPDLMLRLRAILDASLAAYRASDDLKGAHLLQDFERLIRENVH